MGLQRRRGTGVVTLACVPALVLGLSACGSSTSGDRQDKDEPSGEFPVEVQEVSFPSDQKLAESSTMKIVVRNAGNQEIPNIAVTVQCRDSKDGQNGSFDRQIEGDDNADKNRPIFVVDRIPGSDRPESNLDLDPLERSSAYVNTYTLGPLAPNREATFEWKVTAVHAGNFRVCYRVSAGLDGKAVAKQEGGEPLERELTGTVSNEAPQTGIADDGETVTTVTDTESGE